MTLGIAVICIILATHLCGTLFAMWFYVFKRYTKFSWIFAWYYIWIGGFYDTKEEVYYWFPLPMIGIKFSKQ